MSKKEKIINQLKQEEQQLIALIKFLEKMGPDNPHYYRTENLKKDRKLIISQLKQLNEIN